MIIVRNGDGYPFRQPLDRTFAHTVHGTAAGSKLGGRRGRSEFKKFITVVAGTTSIYPGRDKRVAAIDLRPGRAYARNEDRYAHDARHTCTCKDADKSCSKRRNRLG